MVSAPRSLVCTFSEARNSMPRCSRMRDRREDVGCAEADALQVFLVRRVFGRVVGLDQLQVEALARALQQQSLGQDAEADVGRERREAEDLRVELHPVRGAVDADVLDDPEKAHPALRRRMRVDVRDGAEVDVVDRELVVAVDEIDEALADAVDRGDVELHRPRAHRNFPRAELERAVECGIGVVEADGDRAQDRRLDRLHGSRNVGRLRIDDDVHRALPVELHLARAMMRDRPEPHHFQHAAQRLRLRRRELDEFDAVDAERVEGFGDRLAVHRIGHRLSS